MTGAGLGVRVLEASDGVGGRMRSDRHEGFVIDRGFQVFNTSYPQVRRRLALRALRLRPFTPGVLVHTDDGPLRFSDPTRGPAGSATCVRDGSQAVGTGRPGCPVGPRHAHSRPFGEAWRRPHHPHRTGGRRRYVCGDHRATGSVQGALASGAHAAREVARDLAAQSPMGG
ncbi:FAD-dependent oxidoreductase [Streptomyces mirabilis]|uniref:FAD-dependent oxidoreductase n=1 Tax=Streptomyces mirabilis TaxID=68239 RepID=UPI0036776F21